MKNRIALTLGMILCATTAWAGGPVKVLKEPTVAPALPDRDWQGLYLGLSVAKPLGDNVFGRSDLNIWSTPADWTGTPVTIRAGHDWQRGRMVYGLALDLTIGDISNPTRPSPDVICFVDCEIAVSGLQTLRGRVGVVSGRTLIYATAGLARADARFTTLAGVVVIGEGPLQGWTAGLGLERRMTDHLSLTAEYRHTDLGVLPLDCFATCQTPITFGTAEIGVSYRW